MKKFEEICMMTQAEVKTYMQKYLSSKKYKVVNKDGYLYAKGTVPVLLVAHMDTVHKEICKKILIGDDGIISSPQGIGGDDRCGIFIIMNIVQDLNCSVLLCEDEETGGNGARKFTKSEYINDLDVNYIIEFDRKGNNDAVFYSCDNKDFTKFVTETTGFKEAFGTFSDISVVAPAAKIAAVNLSCGYYNAHTLNEYVKINEMLNTIKVAKKLIKTESDAFEYVARQYKNYNYYYGNSFNDYYGRNKGYNSKQLGFSDYDKGVLDLELEIVFTDIDGEETFDYVSGKTKAECWAKFFIDNPDVCFAMVTDYSFM